MKIKMYLLLATGLLLIPAMTMAQEPLGIAEEGSPEAERLRRAHEADVQGAMESPEEAERRNRRMRGEGGSAVTPTPRPEPHYTPPPPEPSSSNTGVESDLQLETGSAAARRDARMRGHSGSVAAAPPPPSYSAPAASSGGAHESDLAIGANEPMWLGGTRVSTRRRSVPMRADVSVDAEKSQIKTPPFLFNAWSTNLSDGDRRVLERVASIMKEKPNEVPKVQVSAYTDNSGDSAINEALTIARANVVKAYLILQGVGVHRVVAKGYGDSNPIESNETKAGRAKNRRIEFKIIK